MTLLRGRLHKGQERFGLWHNLTTDEPVPYYIEVHAVGCYLMLLFDRK
jgi:2-keto-3-deoxy-L-rhamnonate aldolase RhmA